MAPRKCAACQAEMDADAIFCNECGLAQPDPQADLPPPTIHVPTRPESASPFAPAPTFQASPPVDFTTKECPQCGTTVARHFKFCSKCAFDFDKALADPEPVTAPSLKPTAAQPAALKSEGWFSPALTVSVKKRYREGYLYARFLNGFGGFVILVGIAFVVLGGFLALSVAGASMGFGASAGAGGMIAAAVVFSIGLFFGGIFVIFGILIRAGAQGLIASFDGVVNSSPFLTDADRAEMMSLPTFGAAATSGNIAKFD